MASLPLHRRPAVLAVAAAVLLAAPTATAAGAAAAPAPDAPGAYAAAGGPQSTAGLDRRAARFETRLAGSDYVSQQGSVETFDLNRKYCEGAAFSGLWPNPQSPYLVSELPEVPGQAPNTNPPVTWRLRQDEAVVLIGRTPPPEEYFSFDLGMMRGSLKTGPIVWPEIGDPINNRTVRTTGSGPFDRPFALVVTGNRRTRAELDRMLADSGLYGAVNNMTIPPAMFRLGLGPAGDQFMLGMRTTAPDPGYEKALDDYRAAPPVRVFRVRPQGDSRDQTRPVYPPYPLPVPRLRVPGTGATELNLNPALQLLRRRIIDSHPGYAAHDLVLGRGFEESYPGLQQNLITDPPTPGIDALSYDADDPLSPAFRLPAGSFVVAYGTNHVATGQATYSSITLYADRRAAVSVSAENNRDLFGSARDFIPDLPDADAFYAWTFSRAGDDGPSGPHVTMLPSPHADFCARYGGNRHVDLTTLQAVGRAYMQPATLTRPALSALLLDRLLVFTPK